MKPHEYAVMLYIRRVKRRNRRRTEKNEFMRSKNRAEEMT